MRLSSITPALAVLALAACDSTGALRIAQAPAQPVDCCCKASAPASCPTAAIPPASPVVAQAPVMAPEPTLYRPAIHRQAVVRRPAARRVAQVQSGDGEVREFAYAGGRTYDSAPTYDDYAEVADRRMQGRVEARETYREHYSERSEGYGDSYESRGDDRDCGGCAPREAAGRDRGGFLTWPGKVPARWP